MINAVSLNKFSNTNFTGNEPEKPNTRYLNIKYSGYASLGFMGVCALTGLRQIKIPNRVQVHKYSAMLTTVTALWHLGTIKKWDKLFLKKNN